MQQSWQKYQLFYQLEKGSLGHDATFYTEADALAYIKACDPYCWRLDVFTQVYLQEGGPGAPIMEREEKEKEKEKEKEAGPFTLVDYAPTGWHDNLNARQKAALLEGYRSGRAPVGPSTSALSRRGLVDYRRARALTPAGEKLAKALLGEPE